VPLTWWWVLKFGRVGWRDGCMWRGSGGSVGERQEERGALSRGRIDVDKGCRHPAVWEHFHELEAIGQWCGERARIC
jgi:hypothetical protein